MPSPGPMRRILIGLLGALVVGAFVNMMVAWSFAAGSTLFDNNGQGIRPPTPPGKDRPDHGWLAPERLDWPCEVPGAWESPTVVNWSAAVGCRWDSGVVESSGPDSGTDILGRTVRWACQFRFGWPLYSLSWRDGTYGSMTSDQAAPGPWSIRAGVPLPPSVGSASVDSTGSWRSFMGFVPRRLPLVPLWPGFLVNSALYGLALAGMVLGYHRVMRARRRRRGLCESCGYDVRRLDVCPECGTARNTAPATISPPNPGPHE